MQQTSGYTRSHDDPQLSMRGFSDDCLYSGRPLAGQSRQRAKPAGLR